MKSSLAITLLFLLAIIVACGSSKENKAIPENTNDHNSVLSDTTDVTTPPDINYTTGNVYLDNVSKVKYDDSVHLKITGSLPDGCSKLYQADYSIQESVLHLDLMSWRPAGAICTQALVEFTHITDKLTAEDAQNVTHYLLNGKQKELDSAGP